MIKVKLITNMLREEGRAELDIPFVSGMSLRNCLDQSGFDYKGLRIIVSGKKVDYLDIKINDSDEVIITPDLKFQAVALWWAAATFWQGVAFVAGALMTAYSVVSAIISVFNKPKTPNFGSTDDSSPTYGWDGIQTTQDVNIPIGIIYGEHKVGGNIINAFVRTDGDLNYLNVLLALGEGEVESISSVKINDQTYTNFNGVTYATRMGTLTQTMIPNFNDLHNLYAQASAMMYNTAVEYTTIGSSVEAFELHFLFQNGLYQQSSSSGALQAYSVTYTVGYRPTAVGTYISLGTQTITAKSRTAVRRVFRKDGLAAGKYDIQVTRTSANSSTYVVADMTLDNIDEIQTDDLAYPGTALLGIEAMATDQLSGGMPRFSAIVKGKKISIPAVMNGTASIVWEDYYWDTLTTQYKLLSDDTALTWDGSTYETAYSANPVWCLRDLIINTRYGLGEFVDSSLLDETQLVNMSRVCDERVDDGTGNYEKRYRLDMVIDQEFAVPDLLQAIAGVFRGIIFFSEGGIKIVIDKAASATQLFGMGNIISMSQGWHSVKDMPNVIEVQFLDKDKDYEKETIAVINEEALAAGDPMRKKTVQLYCTRVSQAIREGRYRLKLGQYIDRTIALKVGIDAVACQPGDRIDVAHDVPQWGYSGRAVSGSSSTLIADQSLSILAGTTYKIQIRHSDDTIEEQTVTNAVGASTAITVSTFSQVPAAYDVYSFGPSTKVNKPFRVMSMRANNNNEIELSAIEYDTGVYDDTVITLPTSNYSSLSLDIPPVTNVSLSEEVVKLSDGTIENAINVWFKKPELSSYIKSYDRAKIYISDNGGTSWNYYGETRGESFQIIGGITDSIEYTVAVVAVSFMNEEASISSSPQDTITLVGKSALPSDVTNFIVLQFRDNVVFTWDAVTDIDLSGYEIRYGTSWSAGFAIASNLKSTSWQTYNIREGATQNYWIKAIDTSNNYSETATQGVVSIDSIPFTNIMNTVEEEPLWTGSKTNTVVVGSYLEIGATFSSGVYETTQIDLSYVATFRVGIEDSLTAAGSRRFDTDGTTEWDDSPTDRFTGSEVAGAASYRIRYSDDASVWSSYANWAAGDYNMRYYQLEMTMTRASLAQTLQCTQLHHYADLPDVDEFGSVGVGTAASGGVVTFAKTFHEEPAVLVAITAGNGFISKLSSKSTTGFTATLYNTAHAAVTGSFDWHCHGV